jgi:hypothetical protein
MTRLLGLLVALVFSLVFSPGQVAVSPDASALTPALGGLPVAERRMPTRAQWLADVKAAMAGSRSYVKQRAAARAPQERLAVNFDIDNTVIATYYGGGAIPLMVRFARLLDQLDVALVFASARLPREKKRTIRQLTKAGFPVAELCFRRKGETIPVGKERCRDGFVDEGWTLIANVGNNDSDFVGDNYEQPYRLPNYGVLR